MNMQTTLASLEALSCCGRCLSPEAVTREFASAVVFTLQLSTTRLTLIKEHTGLFILYHSILCMSKRTSVFRQLLCAIGLILCLKALLRFYRSTDRTEILVTGHAVQLLVRVTTTHPPTFGWSLICSCSVELTEWKPTCSSSRHPLVY